MRTRILPLGIVIVALLVTPAVSGRFDTPAGVFDARVSGTGRPVILIPGLATTGAVWDATVGRLKDRAELHALTLAGFGGPAAIGEPFLPRVASAIVDYTRARRLDRPVLVGHSLGGFVAFMAAADAPDLFGGVLALDGVPFLPALSNPGATGDTQAAQAKQIKTLYASLTREQFLTQNEIALTSMISDPDDRERARRWASQSDPAAVGVAVAEMLTTDLRERVGAIKAPVLLVGALGAMPEGMRPAAQAAYRAQVARAPDASVIFAERARHFIMLDDPEFFATTLDAFLVRTAAAGER